jgi:hypothetical protein
MHEVDLHCDTHMETGFEGWNVTKEKKLRHLFQCRM